MLCTNVLEIPFSYMKLLLIIKYVQNDRFLVKIESRLLETLISFVLNINLRLVK